jgi:NAD(P)-dependent dehydrogenase (short-subunit alcohol dehydrogenase family)
MTAMTVMVLSSSLAVAIVSILAVIFWNHKKALGSSVHIPSRSAVLVTGCSRGIGKHLAESLAQRGYTVLGTVRSQSSYNELERQLQQEQQLQQQQPATETIDRTTTGTVSSPPGRIYPILLDVTNSDATYMKQAVESVTLILNRHTTPPLQLIGIINNAGINPEAEQWKSNGDIPPNALSDPLLAERVLSTNVLGCIRVTHAFVPLLQQQQVEQEVEPSSSTTANNHQTKPASSSGRIVLIGSYFGSLAGAIGLPHVYYEASKHALEGLADGMRRGFQQQQQNQKQQQNSTSTSLLRPVEVSLIKPGNIQTDMNRYGEVGPDQVTQVVLHALESNHPRHRYYPGTVKGMSSRFLCTVFDILPTWFTDKLL